MERKTCTVMHTCTALPSSLPSLHVPSPSPQRVCQPQLTFHISNPTNRSKPEPVLSSEHSAPHRLSNNLSAETLPYSTCPTNTKYLKNISKQAKKEMEKCGASCIQHSKNVRTMILSKTTTWRSGRISLYITYLMFYLLILR